MTPIFDTPGSTSGTSFQENVRTYTYLLLRRQNLDTRKHVLEELIIKCGRPLSSPATPSTVLSSSVSPCSTASSTPASSYTTYPQRSSSLDTSISSFSSTPCPWKSTTSQHSLEAEAESDKDHAGSATVARRECSILSANQLSVNLRSPRKKTNTAQQIAQLAPLTPNLVKPKAKPSSNKHYYHRNAMAATVNSYQDTELEMVILDLEIELLIFRKWRHKIAEEWRKAEALNGVRPITERKEDGSGYFQRAEKVRLWPTYVGNMAPSGNFF